jgi:hypothetical protein
LNLKGLVKIASGFDYLFFLPETNNHLVDEATQPDKGVILNFTVAGNNNNSANI